jgi:von Willebrand factor type A domain
MRTLLRATCLALATIVVGCGAPALTREGQFVFTPGGQQGAAVLTANGVEIVDRTFEPAAVHRSSPFQPWRAPTGFLMPANGVFTARSKPVSLEGRGLVVVLRSSDQLVPSWGGEVLLRLDAIVPERAFPAAHASLRPPVDLVVVTDDGGDPARDLIEDIFDDLGESDRVALVDAARGARTAVPLVPGSNRSLLDGTVERLLAESDRDDRELGHALELARHWATLNRKPAERHVVVVSDARGLEAERGAISGALAELARDHVRVTVVAPEGTGDAKTLALFPERAEPKTDDARFDAAGAILEPPGATVLHDVQLEFESVPAPVHVLEASGGRLVSGLDEERLDLGDLYVGEARTEVVRLAIPEWVPGEPFTLSVRAHYKNARTQAPLESRVDLHMRYSQNIQQLANQRAGDVIAYASALAMVRRLERAFLGRRIDRIGGLTGLVRWQARSLGIMAQERSDPSLARQAEILSALLGALGK